MQIAAAKVASAKATAELERSEVHRSGSAVHHHAEDEQHRQRGKHDRSAARRPHRQAQLREGDRGSALAEPRDPARPERVLIGAFRRAPVDPGELRTLRNASNPRPWRTAVTHPEARERPHCARAVLPGPLPAFRLVSIRAGCKAIARAA